MKMVQCKLLQRGKWTTGWLPERVKIGDWVRLDGEEGWWRVMSRSEPVRRSSIRRGWKNDI